MTVVPAGQKPTPADFLNTSFNSITAGYFQTMGMRILSGRDLTPNDEPAKGFATKAVVNQAFAGKLFPGVDPIGRRFGNTGQADQYEVAGVVNDREISFAAR